MFCKTLWLQRDPDWRGRGRTWGGGEVGEGLSSLAGQGVWGKEQRMRSRIWLKQLCQ